MHVLPNTNKWIHITTQRMWQMEFVCKAVYVTQYLGGHVSDYELIRKNTQCSF